LIEARRIWTLNNSAAYFRSARFAGFPQVISRLLPKPEIGPAAVFHTKPAFQPQCHFRGNGCTGIEYAG